MAAIQLPEVSATPTLNGDEVGLALRYLTDYRVIVVVHPADPAIRAEAIDAAGYAGAHLVIVTEPGAASDERVPAGALVIAAVADAIAVAGLIGRYAAAIDRGEDPTRAFGALVAAGA